MFPGAKQPFYRPGGGFQTRFPRVFPAAIQPHSVVKKARYRVAKGIKKPPVYLAQSGGSNPIKMLLWSCLQPFIMLLTSGIKDVK